jgi:hypothetical protein
LSYHSFFGQEYSLFASQALEHHIYNPETTKFVFNMAIKTATVAVAMAVACRAQQMVMYSPGGDDTSVQRIDPILAPGKISQHVHQVFGANKLSPTLDYDELQSSSCTTVGSADFQGNAQDHSIYWHPSLYMEGNDGSGYIRVPTNGHKLYYLDIGTGTKAEPFEYPAGFRMLAGDPFLRSPASNTNIVQWKCSTGGSYNVGDNGGFPTGVSTCSDYPYFYSSVEFPHCWNGDDYDPANPTAHMAYPEGDARGGSCPSSHPKRLPHLFIESFFNIDEVADKVKPDSFVLAQGDNTGYGMHHDFFNGWEKGALPALLSGCPQPQWGNEDVGTCPGFKSSGSASSCTLPTQFKEDVDAPGKFLPGCNPIVDTSPAPRFAVAPLGTSTDKCDKAAGNGGSSAAPSSAAPSASGYAPSGSAPPAGSSSGGASQPAASSAVPSVSYGSYAATSTALMTTFATSTFAYSPSAGAAEASTRSRHQHHGWGHARPSWRGGW